MSQTHSSNPNQQANTNNPQSKTNTMTNKSNLSYSAFNIDEELKQHLNNIEDSLSDIIPVQSSLTQPPPKISNLIILETPLDKQKMEIDLSLAVKGYPDILSYLNFDTKQLTLPDWIDIKMLRDYFEYVKLCLDVDNTNLSSIQNSKANYNFKKLTQLTNYFNNDTILSNIIKFNIEPNINEDNCFSLITDAFNYCASLKSGGIISTTRSKASIDKVRALWFKLFLTLRHFIISNLLSLLSSPKIAKLSTKLLEDFIEAFLLEIYSKGIEISNEQALKLIKVIIQMKKCNRTAYCDKTPQEEVIDDAIGLLKEISQMKHEKHKPDEENETIKELKGVQPSFSIDLLNDINCNYQEKAVQFHKQELIFITRYDKSEDVFTVNLKLNTMNRIDVFSFLSYAHIAEDKDYEQFHSRTLNTGMSHCVFKINSYKVYLHYMKEIKDYSSIHLQVNLKFHIIQSFVLCYLRSSFSLICQRQSLSLLPLNLFQILFSDVVPEKEEEPLLAVMNWLVSEDNCPEDILPLLEGISWNDIPLGRIFEFVIKYPKLLSNTSIESNVIAAIFSKANRKLIEMKKDKMYQASQSYEKQLTQLSYEGDEEKFAHIASGEKMKVNKDDHKIKPGSSELGQENGVRSEEKAGFEIDENQIGIIAYFFVNLVECSKRLNYQRIVAENKELKCIQQEHKDTNENKSLADGNKKVISSYRRDKLEIFNFNQSKESVNESKSRRDRKCNSNSKSLSNRNEIIHRSKSNSKAMYHIGVTSCNNDQIIKMPSISHIGESHQSNMSLSISNISSLSNKSNKARSDNSSKSNLQQEKQSSIKLKSIALGGGKEAKAINLK